MNFGFINKPGGKGVSDNSRARFWWGISFLCNMVAVWFIQPFIIFSGMMGYMGKAPAALVELDAVLPVPESATTMAEILCLVALLIGVAAASKAASKAG